MADEPTMVTMRERVRVVKVDKDHPEKPPEIIEQETLTKISLDEAAMFGFTPLGECPERDAPNTPVEGIRVGDA